MRALQVLAWMSKAAESKKSVIEDKLDKAHFLPANPNPTQPVSSKLTNLGTRPYVGAGKMLSNMASAAVPALTYVKNRYVHPGMNFVSGDFDLSRINKPAYGDPRWEDDYNTAKTYAFDPDPARRLNAATKMQLDSELGKHEVNPGYYNTQPGSIPLADRIKARERFHNDYWKMMQENRDREMLHGTVDAVNKVTAPGMQSVWNLHPQANKEPINPYKKPPYADPGVARSGFPRPQHPSTLFNRIVRSNEHAKTIERKLPSAQGRLDDNNNWAVNNWLTQPDTPAGTPEFNYYPNDSANAYILKNIINSPYRLKLKP